MLHIKEEINNVKRRHFSQLYFNERFVSEKGIINPDGRTDWKANNALIDYVLSLNPDLSETETEVVSERWIGGSSGSDDGFRQATKSKLVYEHTNKTLHCIELYAKGVVNIYKIQIFLSESFNIQKVEISEVWCAPENAIFIN